MSNMLLSKKSAAKVFSLELLQTKEVSPSFDFL